MDNKEWNKKKYAAVARQAAAEGIVLLRNENHALPLREKDKIAIFGRSQFHYYKSGTGSGGAVNVDYVVGIYEAMEASRKYIIDQNVRNAYTDWVAEHPFNAGAGWASEPWAQEEMRLSDEFVQEAARESSVAIMLIGRTAGEDQDNKNEQGSYLLTNTEKDVIKKLCNAFSKTIILLNVGNIIDMSWVEEYKPDAVAYVWQGGQEGGNGVLDVVSGAVNPCGKLSDTIAASIEDYPSTAHYGNEKENFQVEDIYVGYRYFETFAKDKVLYPFGFGLSYTDFAVEVTKFQAEIIQQQIHTITIQVDVTNSGQTAGKEVVQIYVKAPQGKLGKAERVLCGFAKTKVLQPGKAQSLTITIQGYSIASYDDSGITGHKSAYVLEAGEYEFFAGTDVRSAKVCGTCRQTDTVMLEQCKEALAPVQKFERMKPAQGTDNSDTYEVQLEQVPLQTIQPRDKRAANLPENYEFSGDKGYKLVDVADGKVSIEDFLAQLTDEDLCVMMRGEGMSSPKVTPGIAGAFGGVTDRLVELGIPTGGCADGPSGIRMDCGLHAFSLPNGTCLACSFNQELSEELYEWEGLELRKDKIDALLGPGMNIHRNPLNGRNFEYFSEDPFLTGKMAAAQLRGMHKYDVTGTIKHFACNTQEFQRTQVDSVVSERAAREIYMKGFEIAVKEGQARSIMSTYGPINGVWTAGNYELLTQILREEWGFTGIVMTDWWALSNDAPGAKATKQNVAAQVRAQNDLNMVVTCAGENSNRDNLLEALNNGSLTRGELQRSAANICRFLIASPAFLRMTNRTTKLDQMLEETSSEDDLAILNKTSVIVSKEGLALNLDKISLEKGKTSCFEVRVQVRGTYDLKLTMRGTGGNALAQIPISIYRDQNLLQSITLRGSENQWQEFTIPLGVAVSNLFYLRFYVAQAGLELKDVCIELTENWEERIQQYMAAQEVANEGK